MRCRFCGQAVHVVDRRDRSRPFVETHQRKLPNGRRVCCIGSCAAVGRKRQRAAD